MAYRNTFFRWLFLYSLTFGLTYVLKLFTYLCPETGHLQCDFWQLSVCQETLNKNHAGFEDSPAFTPQS